jgi:hypothetical protein
MAITQRRLIDVIREQCSLIDERVPGYQAELADAVADIMVSERDHSVRATAIQHQVTEHLEHLGDFLWRKTDPATSLGDS